MLTIHAAAGDAEAIVCRPATGSGPWPGVLLFMDAIGLRPQIRQLAQRIADWGYVVLAPNTFYRTGDVTATAASEPLRTPEAREAFFAGAREHLKALTGDVMDADAPAYVDALLALPDVRSDAVGVVGFCMGARLAVRAAGLRPDVVAAAAGFHGGALVTPEINSPHVRLQTAKAEFVFGHADQDRSMTAENVEELGRALAAAGLQASNEIFPGAPHGYTMADTASYHEPSAERAMAELHALFDRVLARPRP